MQQLDNLISQTSDMHELPKNWSVVRLDSCLQENLRNGLYKPAEFLGKGQAKLVEISTLYNCDRILDVNHSLKAIEISEDEERRYALQDNDVLINRVSKRQEGVAQARLVRISKTWKQSVVFESNMLRARFDAEQISPDFFSFYASTGSYLTQVLSKAQKANQTSINQQALSSILLPRPPLPEQFAIAHTLRTIQKAKEARQRELELERECKAALIQYLFTQGTRNEPRKKTEIGDIPQSWDVVPVGKICDSIVPARNKPKRFDGDIPWITIPDIRGKTKIEASLSGLAVSKEVLAEAGGRIIPSGSVIMSCVGNFGITSIAGRDLVINQQLHAFICPEYLDAYFLSHALQRQKSYMEAIALVTVVAYLSKDKCNSVPIPLPSPDEQKEITQILIACDTKITALEQESAFLDELFRAMLEALMTGRLSALPLVEEKAIT